jgi:hypothetical protein
MMLTPAYAYFNYSKPCGMVHYGDEDRTPIPASTHINQDPSPVPVAPTPCQR